MITNYSRDLEYHSQRNNMIVPFSSCNTTSAVMALKQAHHKLPKTSLQPEDALSELLLSPQAYTVMMGRAPWAFDHDGAAIYPPQQVHAMLEWGINEWMGREVDHFSTDKHPMSLIPDLDSGCGIILSGLFPMPWGELGHIVSLAGYSRDDVLEALDGWVIDDPYGDWHTGFANTHGNDVLLSTAEFNDIFLRGSTVWAHTVEAT